MIAKTGLNPLFCIKAVSILFEYLLAYFIGRIACMKWHDKRVMWMALAIVPLLPSVLLNSAYLSQCDAIYAAFAVGGIYYALREKPWVAVLFLGVSFALKMQAVMVLPVSASTYLATFQSWDSYTVNRWEQFTSDFSSSPVSLSLHMSNHPLRGNLTCGNQVICLGQNKSSPF